MYYSDAISSTRFTVNGLVAQRERSLENNQKSSSIKGSSPIAIIRHYLTTFSPAALALEALHNELAMRAQIILEYMNEHAIADIHQGIRQFAAFERQRLQQLGIISTGGFRLSQ